MDNGWRLSSNKPDSSETSAKVKSDIQHDKKNIEFTLSDPKYKISDMIISQNVYNDLKTIINAESCWDIVFNKWNLSSVIKDKQNILVNLYGAPGTGKTMAAHAIAYELHKQLICVNYADIESKYVGETSKNITALFKFAADKNAIIFFDEADALLSKRVTDMSSATDVSVNQTRSVLLTLMNDYKGMIIFASNFISNYDSAFIRRIQYHVKFELPDAELREKLWQRYIPSEMPNNLDISLIAGKYACISGSDISNAVLKAALYAASNKKSIVYHEYFENAIESILNAKKANSQNEKVTVTSHEVSEEYAIKQISTGKDK